MSETVQLVLVFCITLVAMNVMNWWRGGVRK